MLFTHTAFFQFCLMLSFFTYSTISFYDWNVVRSTVALFNIFLFVYLLLLVSTVRGAKMQMWTKIGSNRLSALLRNRRFPRKPDMTINVPGLNSPVNIDDNYGLRLTAYYRVRKKTLSLKCFIYDRTYKSKCTK